MDQEIIASLVEAVAALNRRVNDLGSFELIAGPPGPAGADGKPGPPPTEAEIRQAAAEWLAANITQPADGQPGPEGPQGPQGEVGPRGPEGRPPTDAEIELAVSIWLEANRASLRGADGRNGVDGVDGRDGIDGRPGPAGPIGPTGPQGIGIALIEQRDENSFWITLDDGREYSIDLPVTFAQGGTGVNPYNSDLYVNSLAMNTNPRPRSGVGLMQWNDTEGTIDLGLKGGNVTLQIGLEEFVRVRNNSGGDMVKGQAVYVTGSTGNHLDVQLAQANGEATSSKTLAVIVEPISHHNTGFAAVSGQVTNMNTAALTEGAAIWLSPTVPGGLTTTKPQAPDNLVLVGWCVRQHATNGVIYVHVQNGFELDELHNVKITSPQNGNVLVYDSAQGLWVNGAGTGNGTVTSVTASGGTTGLTFSGSPITTSGTLTLGGTLAASNGGTGQTTYSNGQLLIGKTDGTLAKATLTAGTGVSVTNGDGTVTITNAAPDQIVALVAGTGIGVTGTYPNFTITNGAPDQTVSLTAGTGMSVTGTYPSFTVTNTAPDQVVALTGAGTTVVTGTYPNFTITSNDQFVGTVTSVNASGGTTGLTFSGGPVTSSGTLTLAGTLATANGGTGQTTYTDGQLLIGRTSDGSLAKATLTAGTGISVSNGSGAITITNSAPDQTVSLTAGSGISVTGTYPSFTIAATGGSGTVTSINVSGGTTGLTFSGGPVTTSGTITMAGTLGVANGGTGATTLTGVVIGNGTSAFTTKTNPSGAFVGTTDIQTLTNKTLTSYTETVFAITDGATVNLDPNNGPIQTWTLGASRTPGQANWAAGQSITLMIDDGTAFTITWSTLGVVWKTDGGSAPTLQTTGFTVIVLWKVGTTIYGARVGNA